MIPNVSRYHVSSRQLLVPFDYQYPFLSKITHIKRVAGYLFCTGRNGIELLQLMSNHKGKIVITYTDKFLPLKL